MTIENIKHCIICGEEIKIENEEHVIPLALGGKYVVNSICKECNSRLGDKADCLLADDNFFLLLRYIFNVPNRDGLLVDIINTNYDYKDESGQKAIIKKTNILGQELKLRYVPETNKVVFSTDGKLTYQTNDFETIINVIKKKCKKENIKYDLKLIEEQIYKNTDIKFNFDKLRHDLKLDLSKYIPCIIKIVHEFMFDNFGEKYLDHKLGQNLKNLIYNNLYEEKRKVEDDKSEIILNVADANEWQYYHCISLVKNNNDLMIVVNLFKAAHFCIVFKDIADYFTPQNLLFCVPLISPKKRTMLSD